MILLLVLISLPFLATVLVRTISGTSQPDERNVIVKHGCVIGLPPGAFLGVLNLFGNVIPVPAGLEAIVDRVFAPFVLGLALLAFSVSGYRTSRLTGHLRAAALAGLLTAVFVFFLFGLSFVIIDMVFFDVVRQQPEKLFNFAHSGYTDMRTYLFDSTVRGAIVMTLVGGPLGAIFGGIGALVGNRKLLRRRMA